MRVFISILEEAVVPTKMTGESSIAVPIYTWTRTSVWVLLISSQIFLSLSPSAVFRITFKNKVSYNLACKKKKTEPPKHYCYI